LLLEQHDADGEAWRDLMLDARCELQVVLPVQIDGFPVGSASEVAAARTWTNLVVLNDVIAVGGCGRA
jgi:hypothetical protein